MVSKSTHASDARRFVGFRTENLADNRASATHNGAAELTVAQRGRRSESGDRQLAINMGQKMDKSSWDRQQNSWRRDSDGWRPTAVQLWRQMHSWWWWRRRKKERRGWPAAASGRERGSTEQRGLKEKRVEPRMDRAGRQEEPHRRAAWADGWAFGVDGRAEASDVGAVGVDNRAGKARMSGQSGGGNGKRQ